MDAYVDAWLWINSDDIGEANANIFRKKLTLVDSINKSAIIYHSYQEKDGRIAVPRSFLSESVTSNYDVSIGTSNGFPWPEKAIASADSPWAEAQDGDSGELTLVDAVTGDRSADFFSADQNAGIGLILKSLCGRQVGDGIAIFSSEHAAAKVCLSLIKTMKMRTLVLAPPGAPVAMWKTVAGRYLPDAKAGTIRRGERYEPDAHITISTLDDINDFISHGKIDPKEFGFIISHQIHKMNPRSWAKSISFFSAAKRLGLTEAGNSFTTGLSRVFRYHLGDPVFCADPDLCVPKVRRVWSSWKISSWMRVNPQFVSKETLLDNMCTSSIYNPHIVEQVILALRADRKIILISDKVTHLNLLKMQIENAWIESPRIIDFAIEGMPPDDLAKAIESDVILTTFSFIKSLPEIPLLDTVILATPVRDPIPAARLCLSRSPSKKSPVIVDMRCDDIPICRDYGKSRDALYQSSFGKDD